MLDYSISISNTYLTFCETCTYPRFLNYARLAKYRLDHNVKTETNPKSRTRPVSPGNQQHTRNSRIGLSVLYLSP